MRPTKSGLRVSAKGLALAVAIAAGPWAAAARPESVEIPAPLLSADVGAEDDVIESPLPLLPTDLDGDGVADTVDNCVALANFNQSDQDFDGVGDVCDNCPRAANPRLPVTTEAFAADASDWSHRPRGGADTWHLASTTCFGAVLPSQMYVSNGNAGPLCVADSSRERSQLLGPRIQLPAQGSIMLSFDALSFDQAGACVGSGQTDAKDVGITTDYGLTYVRLNNCTPLADGTGSLIHHDFDIGAFAGQEIQVLFIYDTVNSLSLHTFAVDNVTIHSNATGQANADADSLGDTCDPCTDRDADGRGDPGVPGNTCAADNCPLVANAQQQDGDGDGDGNVCDNCPATSNANQQDTDADGIGDACDTCTDSDHDGFGNPGFQLNVCPVDKCPLVYDPQQNDIDGDGDGDRCDLCLLTPDAAQPDLDGDGVGDACDNCPSGYNERLPILEERFSSGAGEWSHASRGAADTWHIDDGTCLGLPLGSTMYVNNGNLGLTCVADSARETSQLLGPALMVPAVGRTLLEFNAVAFDKSGSCLASGQADAKDVGISLDGGGTYALLNDCFPLTDGSGLLQHHVFDISSYAGQTVRVIFVYDTLDTMAGNTFAVDNVTFRTNNTVLQEDDPDGDALGSLCDNCPLVNNGDQADGDGDGVGNVCDICPVISNPLQEDADIDGVGNACDTCTDTDGDSLGNPGFPLNVCPQDNCPSKSNITQLDLDGDGWGDACDNCVQGSNANQFDTDLDGVGNICDNCPTAANPRVPLLQEDFETGALDWTHQSLGAADTWHLDRFACFNVFLDGTWFVSNGNAGPGCVFSSSHEHSRLMSPPVALPAIGHVTLSFDVFALDELGSCTASGDFDAKDVGITTDGGQTYTLLNDCYPLVDISDRAIRREYDITAFAGQTIQVVFVYDTLDNQSQDTFAVDNVTIESTSQLTQPDADADGPGNPCDNCPDNFNPTQTNADGDARGNVCDNCPTMFNNRQEDLDGDGAGDFCDNCRLLSNPGQPDADADGVGNVCDSCPQASNAEVTVYQTFFQSGAANWTHAPLTGGTGIDTWHLGQSSCFGIPLGSTMWVANGNAGALCVDESAHEQSRLLSPTVALPASGKIYLLFDALSYDEAGACVASGEFDAKDVGITLDGGTTYTLLNDCSPLTDGKGGLVHHEFDISAFKGMTIRVIFIYDTMDDEAQHTFAVDNVRIKVGQPDNDGDLVGNVCDCAPADPSAFRIPSDLGYMNVLTGKTRWTWDTGVEDAGSAITYDMMRGTLRNFPVGAFAETCSVTNSALPFFDQPAIPAPGTGYFFLVRGRNVCGVGTWGQTSSGAERTTAVCP